jgi:hypothetical protein
MTDHTAFPEEVREMPPLPQQCAVHSIILEQIQRDLSEVKKNQEHLLGKFIGNGSPGYDVRLARQEMVTGALIFAVGVVFTGLVGLAIKLLTHRVGVS